MQESKLGPQRETVDLYLIILLHDGRILCSRSIYPYKGTTGWHTSMYKPNIHHANIISFIKAHVLAQFGYDIVATDQLSFVSTYSDTTHIDTWVYKLILPQTVRFKVATTREVKAVCINDLFVAYARNRKAFFELGIDIINLADSTGDLYA